MWTWCDCCVAWTHGSIKFQNWLSVFLGRWPNLQFKQLARLGKTFRAFLFTVSPPPRKALLNKPQWLRLLMLQSRTGGYRKRAIQSRQDGITDLLKEFLWLLLHHEKRHVCGGALNRAVSDGKGEPMRHIKSVTRLLYTGLSILCSCDGSIAPTHHCPVWESWSGVWEFNPSLQSGGLPFRHWNFLRNLLSKM